MENFDELDFSKAETPEDIENILKEKMGVSFLPLQERLCSVLKEKAEELTHDFTNIAPNGDYDKILEDNDGMAEFLKTEAAVPTNWIVHELRVERINPKLPLMLQLMFNNKVVDDGTTLEGYIYLSKTGAIRHAFIQGNGKG